MKTSLLALVLTLSSATAADLKPLMAQPDQVVLQDDFSKAGPLEKTRWGPRQGTQWVIADGVLLGKPSSAEYRAKRKDHFGYEPRISSPATPAQCIAQFSVRFSGGSETPIAPFIELGHHICRLHLTKNGVEMLADHESVKVAEAREFKFEPGKWYHVMAELKGEEAVVQFADGPTLYAKHAIFAKPVESGGNGLGIAGPKDGSVELDNVTLWSVKAEEQVSWAAKRVTLPKLEPVPFAKTKGKAKAE
ncbi:hypothetical protein [Prosthecobacter sp.]|uniref:hypothetical protein n=1 Tax=Prosthecobacter sp. TaxID=1965333 RepID=UPI0037837BD4